MSQGNLSTISALTPHDVSANPIHSTSEAGQPRRPDRSFNDIIAERLSAALQMNLELQKRLKEVQWERHDLQTRLSEAEAAKKALEAAKAKTQGAGRVQAESSARERLVRDDLERKIQMLELELKRERHQSEQFLQKVKGQLKGCICRSGRG